MREIKFRAWNKKRKRMYEVLHLHMPTIMNGWIWATVKGYDIIEDKDIHIQIQPEHIEVMQFTGLKDKNGKEIYEGDVVNYTHATGEGGKSTKYKDFVCEIYFDENDTSFKATWPHHEKYRFRNHSLKNCEVIGNIYENSELLEGNTP